MTEKTPTCPTCGIDLRYPTGLHLVDCPATQANQTPSTEELPQFLTDEEWREFQAIPDQGYSHRHWVNHKIAKYAATTTAP